MQERKIEENMSAGLDQSKREEKLQQGVVRRQRSVEYKEKETMAMGLFREGRASLCLEPWSICMFLCCSYPQH